jgi:hypothetical protein
MIDKTPIVIQGAITIRHSGFGIILCFVIRHSSLRRP